MCAPLSLRPFPLSCLFAGAWGGTFGAGPAQVSVPADRSRRPLTPSVRTGAFRCTLRLVTAIWSA